ncbi:piggyBac transposable element-derived protein 3-like [Schistocerca nitens]|uniref:piggyBac transposable element-derived protein 3-like n=1 Tax=Schistocerca nitens TaxID=7011 RepID=UPI0021192648|nr:piggyBac transposable element-derived protein 3-like [Schistocerca nitens]
MHNKPICIQFKNDNTSGEEMLQVAGIHVVMGVLGYAQSKLYWQQDTQVPVIAKCMTRDRFYELRNYMHFVDNTSEHNEKLWKVKPFLDCVQKKCLTLPRSHHLSVDEQMVPFSGKCGFVTYVPSKPNPLGLKCFILAAPDGLVLDFMFYNGSGTVSAEDIKEYGLGAAVVKMMTESVPRDNQHCVYTDRFFTNVKSVDMLLGRKIYQTVKDNKSVVILSSWVGSSPPTTYKRRSREHKKKIDVPQPVEMKLYNENMGGVDLCDRFLSYYRCYIRTSKWPVRMFNHFIDLVIVNSCRSDLVSEKTGGANGVGMIGTSAPVSTRKTSHDEMSVMYKRPFGQMDEWTECNV